MEIVSHKDARAAGLKRYFTGLPCKRGHVAERMVSTKSCLACKADYEKLWSAENREYIASKSAKYSDRHPERVTAARLARYAADPEKFAQRARRWEENHPEQHRAIRCAITARRRANQRNAALPWLSAEQRAQILQFYDDAIAATKRTGIRHEVDHIVPIYGKTVRGLHVPWNLQVIPMRENRSKGNRITI